VTITSHLSLADLARALGGEICGDQVLCSGPGHSPRDRSLSVKSDGRGGYLVYSFAGDDFRICRDYVAERIGLSGDRRPSDRRIPDERFPTRPAPGPADGAEKRQMALELWREAQPIGGTLTARYLTGRGVLPADDMPVLRHHARTPRGADRQPAMLALMTDAVTGDATGIHRTFLRPDGAAHDGKMMLGAAGILRLSADEDVTHGLGVAEGIETALAVLARGWGPVWACLAAGGIGKFPVLAGIEALTIFADNDDAGLRAAERCADRWRRAGREVRLSPPPVEGTDWAEAAL